MGHDATRVELKDRMTGSQDASVRRMPIVIQALRRDSTELCEFRARAVLIFFFCLRHAVQSSLVLDRLDSAYPLDPSISQRQPEVGSDDY